MFSDFSDLSWSLKLNFSRSKLHFPDLEVFYGWSTFLLKPSFQQMFVGEDLCDKPKKCLHGRLQYSHLGVF